MISGRICLLSSGCRANLTVPGIRQVRYKHANITRPRRAPWFRQKLLAVSAPKWENRTEVSEIWRDCQYDLKMKEKKSWEQDINRLEEFYVREMMEYFEGSKMIAFFHANPMKRSSFHSAWQNGRRIGMDLKEYHYRIGKAGLTGTKWENCLHFWFKFPGEMNVQHILFSAEMEPGKLLSYEKKVPEFSLLGCVMDNRILSKREVQEMNKLAGLEECRGELTAILGHHQQNTLRLLGANQQQLSTNLSQLIKDGSPDHTPE